MTTNKQTNTFDFPPLASIPEYQAAAAKLEQFRAELVRAQEDAQELERLRLAPPKQEGDSADELIARAEALLAGKSAPDLTQRIASNNQVMAALGKAIRSQQAIVNRQEAESSRKAAQRFKAEHIKRVRRVIAAVEELAEANRAETELRNSIEALGYSNRLPGLHFQPSRLKINLTDPYGGYVPAWYEEAKRYVETGLTPEEQMQQETIRQKALSRIQKVARITKQQAE